MAYRPNSEDIARIVVGDLNDPKKQNRALDIATLANRSEVNICGLTAKASEGFRNRATHNLWTLLEEAKWIAGKLESENYQSEYQARLEGSTYRQLVDYLVARKTVKI